LQRYVQSSKSFSQKAYFAPSLWGGVNAQGSSDQISQTAVISEYVSKFGSLVEIRSVTSEIRHQKIKEKKENDSGKI